MFENIIEWQPIRLFGDGFVPFLFAALPGVIAIALRRGHRVRDLLLWTAFAALALKARRGLPDLALISAMLLAHRFPGARVRPAVSIAALAILALLAVLPITRNTLGFERYEAFHSRARPAGLIAFLEARPRPPPRLFNEFDWGGSFFHHWPKVRVFIDQRNDRYPLSMSEAYFIASAKSLQSWQLDGAALKPDDPLVDQFKQLGWRVSYEDRESILLEPR